MLSLLTLWSISAIVFTFIGTPILHLCNLQAVLPKPEDRIFVSIWLGIVVLANLLLLASLFVPLTLPVMALLVALMSLPYLWRRSEYAIKGFSINLATAAALLVPTVLVLVFIALAQDNIADTGDYHLQMIDWLAEYGSVHGLALIHNAFGFTDSWFALTAPLQTGWLKDHFITGMNGFIFWLMSLQAILVLRRILRADSDAGLSDYFFVIAFALFCRFSFSFLMHSPSPDVPVTLLSLIVTWLVIAISVNDTTAAPTLAKWPWVAALILASGAVSFKLSAAPLLALVVIYYVFAAGFSLRKLVHAIAIVAPFAALHLWVSVVTSGCPLFPTPYLCTDLPWSYGSGNASFLSNYISDYNKWEGLPVPPDANSFNWIWFKLGESNPLFKKSLLLALLVVNVVCGVLLYVRRNRINQQALIFTSLLAASGIVFTFLKLYLLRFGLGFFLVLPALVSASLLLDLSRIQSDGMIRLRNFRMPLLFGVAVLSIAPIAADFKESRLSWAPPEVVIKDLLEHAPSLLVWPEPSVQGVVQLHRGNDFNYYQPVQQSPLSLCWNAPLPCSRHELRGIWLRDENESFSGGFVKGK